MSILRVERLSAWWGAAQALFDVTFQVGHGELVLLRGLNGAGKSTLIQAIVGLGPRTTGRVIYDEKPLDGLEPFQRAARGLGYVAEDRRLFPGLTVRENLQVAARGDTKTMQARVLELFPALNNMLERPAGQMSGGEQQMLAIARTLMTQPQLLLLDEPCEGIAPVLVEAIRDTLLSLNAGGMGLLVAEQNELFLAHADRVITLRAGQVDGTVRT